MDRDARPCRALCNTGLSKVVTEAEPPKESPAGAFYNSKTEFYIKSINRRM